MHCIFDLYENVYLSSYSIVSEGFVGFKKWKVLGNWLQMFLLPDVVSPAIPDVVLTELFHLCLVWHNPDVNVSTELTEI